MNALLGGEIDAAQAMTYNEYAQVLEAENPATGELYTPDDFNVIDWNDEGTAMLQDAIWANTERLADDEEYQETTVKFLKASLKGWVYARDNPEEARGHRGGRGLAARHQPPAVADQRGQQADLAVAGRHRHDRRGRLGPDGRHRAEHQERPGRDDHHGGARSEDAYTNEYVEKALAALKDEGVDVTGADFAPIDVTLEAGGN